MFILHVVITCSYSILSTIFSIVSILENEYSKKNMLKLYPEIVDKKTGDTQYHKHKIFFKVCSYLDIARLNALRLYHEFAN